jgi:hypothetical protein
MNTPGNAPHAVCVLYRYFTHPASAAIALVVVMFGCFVSLALGYSRLARYPMADVSVGSGGSVSPSGGQPAARGLQVLSGSATFENMPQALARHLEPAEPAKPATSRRGMPMMG